MNWPNGTLTITYNSEDTHTETDVTYQQALLIIKNDPYRNNIKTAIYLPIPVAIEI